MTMTTPAQPAIRAGRALRAAGFSLALSAALTAALAGCGKPSTPEQQVRETIDSIEEAAEARDVGDMMQHVSKSYRDAEGRAPEELSRFIRGYFIANQAIHVLTRVQSIEFPSAQEARVIVTAGMVSTEADAGAAWNLGADLYELDLALALEEGEWKLRFADYKKK